MLIANSNRVGDWATWPEFRKLEDEGLMMHGQMTAGSWIYIATQGILQGTYETFYAVARKMHEEGRIPEPTLAGALTITGGCGGMGGAQPLAVTLNRRRVPRRGRGRDAPQAPPVQALPGRGGDGPGHRPRQGHGGQERAPGAVRGVRGQRRGRVPGTAAPPPRGRDLRGRRDQRAGAGHDVARVPPRARQVRAVRNAAFAGRFCP